MFTVALCVWLVVFVSGMVLSVWRSTLPSGAGRFVGPTHWSAVVGAGLAGVAPVVSPGVARNQNPAGFSVDRAFTHVDTVAQQSRWKRPESCSRTVDCGTT